MSVAFDAVGPSGGGGTNGSSGAGPWSHTCSGSNRAVVVVVSVENTTIASTTLSATFGGTSMTAIGSINTNNGTGSAGFVAMFGLVNPPTGASNVTVVASPTAGQSVIAGSVSFTGVDQTTPFGTGQTAAGDNSSGSAPPTKSVTSATGNMVVDAICYGVALNNSNGTQRVLDNFSTNSGAGNLMSATYAGAATVSAGATPTGHDWWGLVAVDVKAAAGGSPLTLNDTAYGSAAGFATETVSNDIIKTDTSYGSLAGFAAETPAAVVFDTPFGSLAGFSTETVANDLITTDTAYGSLTGFATETASQGQTANDVSYGSLTGYATETVIQDLIITDVAYGSIVGFATESPTFGGASDDTPYGSLSGFTTETVTFDLLLADTSYGSLAGYATETLTTAQNFDDISYGSTTGYTTETITQDLLYTDIPFGSLAGYASEAIAQGVFFNDMSYGTLTGFATETVTNPPATFITDIAYGSATGFATETWFGLYTISPDVFAFMNASDLTLRIYAHDTSADINENTATAKLTARG